MICTLYRFAIETLVLIKYVFLESEKRDDVNVRFHESFLLWFKYFFPATRLEENAQELSGF
jgi:hypothetical protein